LETIFPLVEVVILSGGPIVNPKLVIKDRSALGGRTTISIGKEVTIEEDVLVSYDCRISDTDGHPRQADLRAKLLPTHAEDIRPVRICRNAWIGNGALIMKAVTIGEGAVIGANSVVVNDLPSFALATGNPAEIYFRNYGRPSQKASGPKPDQCAP
jgi:acetyltransferase-like isoleucine patch superfamily enzyme